MTKTEMKKAENNELIYRYISLHSLIGIKYNEGKSIKSLLKEQADLDTEMLKRGLLTEEQIKKLNS